MASYTDRRQAGRLLASALAGLDGMGRVDPLVLGVPRGGVPVAYEVACALGAPLDVFVVRQLGVPAHEHLAMGAIASGGVCVLAHELVPGLGVRWRTLEAVFERELRELCRSERVYRGERLPQMPDGRTVVLVDDGLASGAMLRAAVAGVRQRRPDRILMAVPIAAPALCQALSAEVDELVCAATPEPFPGPGLWYESWAEPSDEAVRELLAAARQEHHARERAVPGWRPAPADQLAVPAA